MRKHYKKLVKFFYYNKQGRKIEHFVWDREAEDFAIALLESSYTHDLGIIYREDEAGNTRILDYYDN